MPSNSSTVASGDDALFSQYNNLRLDILEKSGEFVTAGGSQDAITLTVDSQITAYATGQVFVFKAAGSNTSSVTVNVNGIGALSLVKDTLTSLSAGDIIAGRVYFIIYDGTRLQLIGVYTSQADLDLLVGGNPITLHSHDEANNIVIGSGDSVLLAEANLEQNTVSNTYTKVKEITIDKSGTYTFSWEMRATANTAFSKIYKDGVSEGVEKSSTSTSYVTYTDINTFAAGEKAQLYIKNNGNGTTDTTYIQNFTITYTLKNSDATATVDIN